MPKKQTLTPNSSKSGGQLTNSQKIPKKALNLENFAKSFESKLSKRSPWLQSILDPIAGAGARIPDPQGFNTATFQFVLDTNVAVNAQGIAAFRVISPYSRSTSGSQANAGGNYQISGAASADANLLLGDGTTPSSSLNFDILNQTLGGAPSSAATSLASRIRVVSGAIYAFYEGTSLSNAGDFILYNNIAGLQGSTDPVQNFANMYGASVLPVNSGKVAIARWLPYKAATGVSSFGSVGYTLSYEDFAQANGAFSGTALAREWGVIMRGGTASTGSVRFRLVINYEWVPRANTGTFIIASPSPIDPMEEAFCMRQLADGQKATQAASPTVLAKVPTSSKVTEASEKETSGILSGITSTVGFIGDILEVALPLLSAIL